MTDLAPLSATVGNRGFSPTQALTTDGVVSLSSTGAGEITYTFDTTYDHDGSDDTT